nr:ABC transporter ATP-binding protein [Desulfobacterales bacterium]
MPILKVRNLTKRFGDVYALNGVSLELSRGEILGILGPNGAGKTTLIHCLLGIIVAIEGTIKVFGKDMSTSRGDILKRMNFAASYVLLPLSLTPYENLMVYALMYDVERPRQRCIEVLKLFDLYDLKDRPARRLSSGQMMRLCLAKAVINEPEILLLDEPTAGLDPEISVRTRKLFRYLRDEKGLAVIYTSHNLHEIEEISDRIILINKGEIVAEGRVKDLPERYAVRNLEEFYFKLLKNEH